MAVREVRHLLAMTRSKRALAFGVTLVATAVHAPARAQETAPECRDTVIAGRVEGGEAFAAALPGGLVFRLDPERQVRNLQGWTIRVTPATDSTKDYAMVVTPPYRGMNARYVSTAYGIPAAETLSLAFREFQYAGAAADHDAAARALDVLLWPASHTETEIDSANAVLKSVPFYPAMLEIEDGGTRDPDGDHPLGLIERIAFRARLCVPRS